MSKSEILDELPKLSPEDRNEIRVRLAEIDEEEWLDDAKLTQAEKELIEERFRALERNPSDAIPGGQAKVELLSSLKGG